MKAISLALGLMAALAVGPALAQPQTTSICLDPGGHTLPVTCQTRASRVQYEEYICQCLKGGEQVTIPICPKGVRPPADSADYERARYAAIKKGSLVGAMYKGRPMCADRAQVLRGE
jgi:hypothetical protein